MLSYQGLNNDAANIIFLQEKLFGLAFMEVSPKDLS